MGTPKVKVECSTCLHKREAVNRMPCAECFAHNSKPAWTWEHDGKQFAHDCVDCQHHNNGPAAWCSMCYPMESRPWFERMEPAAHRGRESCAGCHYFDLPVENYPCLYCVDDPDLPAYRPKHVNESRFAHVCSDCKWDNNPKAVVERCVSCFNLKSRPLFQSKEEPKTSSMVFDLPNCEDCRYESCSLDEWPCNRCEDREHFVSWNSAVVPPLPPPTPVAPEEERFTDRVAVEVNTETGELVEPWEPPAEEEDIVKQPNHYARFKIEPITFVMENDLPFHVGNIIKYACRAGFKRYEGKDDVESEIIDLEKVRRYAEMRITQLKGEGVLGEGPEPKRCL